jgi:hypothetical protein
MATFIVIYNAQEQAVDFMAQSSTDQIEAGMQSWIEWKNGLPQAVSFEFGSPLQPINLITASGVSDSHTTISGYSIMEGESRDLIVEALTSHPHLKRIGATIDVLEMVQPVR